MWATIVANLIETPCNTFLVAEETSDEGSKSMVGCVHVCWSGGSESEDGRVDAQFGMLSVLKGFSGRGIGKFLVCAAGVSGCVLQLYSLFPCSTYYSVINILIWQCRGSSGIPSGRLVPGACYLTSDIQLMAGEDFFPFCLPLGCMLAPFCCCSGA